MARPWCCRQIKLRPTNPIVFFVSAALAFLLTAAAVSIVGYELGFKERAPIHQYGFSHAAAVGNGALDA